MTQAQTASFNAFLTRLDQDQKLLLTNLKALSDKVLAYEETEAFLSAPIPEVLQTEVFRDYYMTAKIVPTGFVNLEVSLGLVVQLTPAEAKEYIPKVKQLLRDKMTSTEAELRRVDQIRKNFEDNYTKLGMAVDGVLARFGIQ